MDKKETTTKKTTIAKTPKLVFKQYSLKKSIKIGNEIKPIGYKISLTEDGYRHYKQQKIV